MRLVRRENLVRRPEVSRAMEGRKVKFQAEHEIAVHGYSHENPIAMRREQETVPAVRGVFADP